jgi:hypothetical protein
MGSTLPQISERSLRLSGDSSVLAVTCRASIINIFQGLERAFLGEFNRLKDNTRVKFKAVAVNNQITRLVQASAQTARSMAEEHLCKSSDLQGKMISLVIHPKINLDGHR